MGRWWGRKAAPDARPIVPAWLTNDSQEEGFARSYSGQFEEVYRRNPVGQRAVRLVAGMPGETVGSRWFGGFSQRRREARYVWFQACKGCSMTNVAIGAEALLASLMAQAEGRGVDLITLRALVEESSLAGARRALASLGLDDERARRDMDELRELLSAWRDAKRSAWRAVVTWAVRVACAMVLIGIAVRLRLTDLVVQ